MKPVSLVDRPMLRGAPARGRRNEVRWLITFADLAAVMVAFFVLLFSMSEVDSDKWEGTTTAFDRQFRISDATVTPRPVETANITQRVEAPALDLGYLERVIGEQLKAHEILREVRVAFDGDRLVLDFPGALVFADGRVGVSEAGLAALFVLGGLFAGVDNQVIVVGDAPPLAAAGAAAVDWPASLERAARIARSLRAAGYDYDRPIVVQGRSGSRFAGAPAPAEGTASAEQRIEIMVLNETGEGQ